MSRGPGLNPLLDLGARPVIAHRGSSAEAPENTLTAFEAAVQRGADALELDVRLTADGAPVVIHDAALDRTTDRTGPVGSETLANLRSVDAGWQFTPDEGRTYPYRGRDARIPTLGEVLWTFPRTPVLVEIKETQAQEAVRRVLLQEGAAERCVVASEHQEALRAFDEPPFARGASGPEISALYWAVLLRKRPPKVRYRFLSVPQRHRGLPVPTRAFVTAARTRGCPVHVWTVDSPASAQRLWRRGVAGIVTNRPGEIGEARQQTA
ncbi:MAG: glycerophosphodiester phosphodiesterase [Gemmatimonadales bacterium]|nr:glycerophosphodiester phosphodiesterase [Gemmatimonadales bacterium]